MRVVIDTNVLVSGVFFGGVPGRILEAWRDKKLTLVVSPAILDEYHRVGRLLAGRHDGVEIEPILALVALFGVVVDAGELAAGLCEDPDDDKFMACALAGGAPFVVSGDKHLRRVSGWQGIEVASPRTFQFTVDPPRCSVQLFTATSAHARRHPLRRGTARRNASSRSRPSTRQPNRIFLRKLTGTRIVEPGAAELMLLLSRSLADFGEAFRLTGLSPSSSSAETWSACARSTSIAPGGCASSVS